MGKYVIDISERFLAGFGFLAKNIAPRLLKVGYNGKFLYGNIDVYDESSHTFDELFLSGNGFDIKFGAMPFLKGDSGLLSSDASENDVIDRVFAPPPMVSFSRSKKIKTTSITDSDVEVIENFGNGSWSIKIQGILIDMENHVYPSKWVKTLNKVLEVNKPYEVASDIFADHGIQWIYFTNIESTGVQGFEDTWKFSLTARSIKPVEFQLKNQ
jgi:hypothetical protein